MANAAERLACSGAGHALEHVDLILLFAALERSFCVLERVQKAMDELQGRQKEVAVVSRARLEVYCAYAVCSLHR
jgi:hypothetical protein